MPRPQIEDLYQNFRFHLFDVPTSGAGLSVPVFALSPQIGFRSVGVPEFDIQTKEINPGNDPFSVTVPIGVNISEMILSRGVYLGDNDFYQWMLQTAFGRGNFRRDLILFQIHPMLRTEDGTFAKFGEISGILAASLAQGALGSVDRGVAGAGVNAIVTGAAARDRLPDVFARVWKLYGCIPTGYKPAESLDANDDSITVQELRLSVEYMEEIAAGPNPIGRGLP